MQPKILLLFLMQGFVFNLFAQFNYSKQVQEAQNAILSLDFNTYHLNANNKKDNEVALYYWLDSYYEFISYESASKASTLDSVILKIQKNIRTIDSFEEISVFYYYTLADMHLFLCYLHYQNNEYYRSVQHYFSAKGLIKTYQKKFSDFQFGGKHLLVQLLVNNIIDQQFGLRTKSNEDMQDEYILLLKKHLTTDNKIYQRELKILGILLYDFQYDADYNVLIKELNIDATYASKGAAETMASSIVFKKTDRYLEQLNVLSQGNNLGFTEPLNSLNLWYGIALLNQNHDSAIYYINRFMTKQLNVDYLPYAQFKASMYWYLNGELDRSKKMVQAISHTSNLSTEEDKQAFYEIGHANNWTPELISARLLFDGGEYQKALSELLRNRDKVKLYSKEQKLEYSYRIGRIYDKEDDLEKAEKFYLMVINSNLDSEFYYPSYSAYYLGKMYLKSGDRDKANYYFTKCSQLDSPIYKASIHKKAKQAL